MVAVSVMQARLRYAFALTLLVFGAGSAYAAGLSASLEAPTVEFGKATTLTLRYHDVQPSLATLDLAELRTLFHVVPVAAPELDARNKRQRWALRLYPYATGPHVVPTLHLADQQSAPLPLHVTEAIDAKSGARIEFSTRYSPTQQAWHKQQIMISADVITEAPIVVLEAVTPHSAHDIITVSPIEREPLTRAGVSLTRHRLNWYWFPLQNGPQRLEPLLVQYQRDGVRTHMFYVAPRSIDVKPLPAYLPATLPVGKLQITAAPAVPRWGLTDRLAELRFSLNATAMLNADIPNLAQQLNSSSALRIYAAEQRRLTQTGNDLNTTVDYRIPFTINSTGWHAWPKLRLQYFDPETARVHTQNISLPRVIGLNTIIAVLVLCVLLWLLWYSTALSYRNLRRIWRRWRAYRLILTRLDAVDSPRRLRLLLNDIARAEGWSANLSLSAWRRHWQQRHRHIAYEAGWLDELSKALYRGTQLDVARHKRHVQELCRQRLALHRLIR